MCFQLIDACVYTINFHFPTCVSYFLANIFGQDKILQSTGRGHVVTVTNDGATILKSLHIDNAAAKVLVGILIIAFYISEYSW